MATKPKIDDSKFYWVRLSRGVLIDKIKLSALQRHRMSGATLKGIIEKDATDVAHYELAD